MQHSFCLKRNNGISVPTDTKQKEECQTAGGTSPVTGACIATSTNTVVESGGVVGGYMSQPGDSAHGKSHGSQNDGISVPTDTNQKQKCQTAGGTSPITGACIGTSTNTVDASGGVIRDLPK